MFEVKEILNNKYRYTDAFSIDCSQSAQQKEANDILRLTNLTEQQVINEVKEWFIELEASLYSLYYN